MKKFLAVFDGFKLCDTTLNYGIQLSKVNNAHLIGVFLDEFIYRDYNLYHVLSNYEKPDALIKELNANDKQKRDDAVEVFIKTCKKAEINFSVHRDRSIALQELLHESMFADLILINEEETFARIKENAPTGFIKNLLGDVQCPVLVLPNKFQNIDNVAILYDGSPSSLHAIKMFSYLFDNMAHLPIEVITVIDLNERSKEIPDALLLKECMKLRFKNVAYTVYKGNADEKIIEALIDHKANRLVVLGAYRRSDLSRWFKRSMADLLIEELETPLFIAHNR
jgi:nucleotide-binding universal stress UspA family protein